MAHVLACKRYPVRKLMEFDAEGNLDKANPDNLIPIKFIEWLEQRQEIASCCRHPENHDIEAWYSSENWMNGLDWQGNELPKGMGKVPDIYKFICTCGRQHVRFCVGGGDVRPFWEVR